MFSQVSLKVLLTRVPSAKTTTTMMAAIAATRRPYSTAEAPSSPRRTSLRILLSMAGLRGGVKSDKAGAGPPSSPAVPSQDGSAGHDPPSLGRSGLDQPNG